MSSSTTLMREETRLGDNVKHHDFLFGAIAYSVSVVTLFPFYKTIFFQQLDGTSWPTALSRLKNEGFYLAYRGVLPPLLQRGSSGAVMFGVQSVTERILDQRRNVLNNPSAVNKELSAIFAGMCEASLMPFERVQTLIQNKHQFPSYRNTFHTLASLVTTHGMKELYRGLSPIIIRNCLGNALYFSGHTWLSHLRSRRPNEGPMQRGTWNFIIGSLLGGSIGIFTYPFNVIKTRMHSTVGGPFSSMLSILSELLYHGGDRADITRLYRGLPANFMRSIVSWGIITMTYHGLRERYSGIFL